jgi:large conductance mechanosensitive channel
MVKGFKEFIMRGNIVDLAVAVVIGSAFAKVVDTMVSSIITPILNRIGGSDAATGLGIQLGKKNNTETFLNLGAIINAGIVFILTALVVYFIIVVPMNKAKERGMLGGTEEEAEEIDEQTQLLSEIRDLLRQR